MNSRKITIGSYVQIASGRYTNFFASVKSKCGNLWTIEYFQKQFGKWTLKDGDMDSRASHELKLVCGTPDTRGRFIFQEISGVASGDV